MSCPRRKSFEQRTTHGMTGSPEYNSWENMWNRCNPKNRQSKNKKIYQKITITKRWKCFHCFYKDLGPRPIGTSLDRINNKKGYFLDNCRWATRKQQQRNRSVNRLVKFNGKIQCLTAWCEEQNLKVTTVYDRIARGWSLRKALNI